MTQVNTPRNRLERPAILQDGADNLVGCVVGKVGCDLDRHRHRCT
jgi:hypothetical protein